MAALFLHNALFAPEPEPDPSPGTTNASASPPDSSGPSSHGSPNPIALVHAQTHGHAQVRSSDQHHRGTSTTTFQSISVDSSGHTSEPLLHPDPQAQSAYRDLLQRQPAHPHTPSADFEEGLVLDEPQSAEEREGAQRVPLSPRTRNAKRRHRRRVHWARSILEALIASWTVYNVVRYFVGAAVYTSHDRHILALVLGAICSLSLLLFALSVLPRHFPRTRRRESPWLAYLSSFLLLVPAVISFVLVFRWRTAPDPREGLRGRCHWDIDVVWSGTGGRCGSRAPAWGVWLAASIVRLVVTFSVLEVHHMLTHMALLANGPYRRTLSSRTSNIPFLRPTSDASAAPSTPSMAGGRMVSLAASPVTFPRASVASSASPLTQPSNAASPTTPPVTPGSGRRKLQKRRTSSGQLRTVHEDPQSPGPGSPSFRRRAISALSGRSSKRAKERLSVDVDSPLSTDDEQGLRQPFRPRAADYAQVPTQGSPTARSPVSPGLGPEHDQARQQQQQQQQRREGNASPQSPDGLTEAQLQELASQFRTIVAQVQRDTEHGSLARPQSALGFTRSGSPTPSGGTPRETPSPLREGDSDSYFPRLPSNVQHLDGEGFRLASGEYVRYAEFGLSPPQRSDDDGGVGGGFGGGGGGMGAGDRVRVLGALIRRMPTIESMGSREGATSMRARAVRGESGSVHTQSRPPTRMTTFTSASASGPASEGGPSQPPSRSNSLSTRHVLDGQPGHGGSGGGSGSGNSGSGNSTSGPMPGGTRSRAPSNSTSASSSGEAGAGAPQSPARGASPTLHRITSRYSATSPPSSPTADYASCADSLAHSTQSQGSSRDSAQSVPP